MTRPQFAKRRLAATGLLVFSGLVGCLPEQHEVAPSEPDVSVSSQALLVLPPELGCANRTFNGKTYFFCAVPHIRDVARQFCKNVGADLVSIGSEAENTFVAQNTGLVAWIGANDNAMEGTWRWASSDIAFWQGTVSGAPIGGRYSKWYWNQPDPIVNLTKDCASTDVTGQWAAQFCTLSLPYVCEEFSPADCNEAVLGRARAAVAPGADILNPLVQADLLRCATPELTPCEAAFHGAVRFDVYLATKQAVAGTITPSRMLAIKRDRARKVNILAVNNPTWITAYCLGDTDGDLVPNTLDACPGTPPLTPTTDTGCTSTATVAGPSAADFQKAMGALGLIRDRDCVGVPPATTPVNLRADGIAIVWGDTQPAGPCEKWYEVKLSVLHTNGVRVVDHFAVRRRDSDANQSFIFDHRNTLCLDAVTGTLGAQCRDLSYPSTQGGLAPPPAPWFTPDSGDVIEIHMRAFDGNGNSSSWAHHYRTMRP